VEALDTIVHLIDNFVVKKGGGRKIWESKPPMIMELTDLQPLSSTRPFGA
jgi:hypothetical protein